MWNGSRSASFTIPCTGLTRSLIANAIVGVTDGYTKTLELMGVGYRVQQSGEGIVLNVGYSHQVEIQPLGWRDHGSGRQQPGARPRA